MKIVSYLSKVEKGAINSGKEVSYFVTKIEIHPHSHPLYISRCIRDHEKDLGLGAENKYYSEVIAIWDGDLYEEFEKVSMKLRSNQKWITSYENELKTQFKQLKFAVELYEDGMFPLNENKTYN